MGKRKEGVDPAAYKLISFIDNCKIDNTLRVWEKQYLSGYLFSSSKRVKAKKGAEPVKPG